VNIIKEKGFTNEDDLVRKIFTIWGEDWENIKARKKKFKNSSSYIDQDDISNNPRDLEAEVQNIQERLGYNFQISKASE